MDMVTAIITKVAWRAAISAIAGVIVSVFAAIALSLSTADSASAFGSGLATFGSPSPVLSAIAGAGFFSGLVVFACLVAYEVARRVRSWLFDNRGLLLMPLRAIAWLAARSGLAIIAALRSIARSTVVEEAVWLVRTAGKALVWTFAFFCVVGGCAFVYLAIIGIGVAGISQSTRVVVAMLDDPPRPLTFALFTGAAVVFMYIGVAAFTLCGWLTYRVTRAGLRRAAAWRLGALASAR